MDSTTLLLLTALFSLAITALFLLQLLRINATQRASAPRERDAAQRIAREYLAHSAYRAATRPADGQGVS